MLPEEAGNFSDDQPVFTQTLISNVDPEAPTGVTVAEDLFEGETVAGYEFTGPCFEG